MSYCLYSLADAQIDPLWDSVAGRDVADLRACENEDLPLFQEIRRRGASREAPLLLSTLKALADGQVLLRDGRVVDAQGHTAPPLDLSAAVETATNPTV
jgi:hypothetical protein